MSPIRRLIHLCGRAGLLLIAISASGGTLHVPAGYPTIQAGINAATNGDAIIVADGTYTGPGNRDLDFAGKAITVESASQNPAACIIDCQAGGRAFHFHNGETAASRLAGFTIRGGQASYGSAILCQLGSGPTITNCVFTGNHATGVNFSNGALGCSASRPRIFGCTFQANTSAGWGAAVALVNGSDAEFADCRFEDNAAGESGALDILRSSATFTDCLFVRNETDLCCGAGAAYDNSSVQLTRCAFLGNLANGPTNGGGGFVVQLNSQADIRDCVFVGNYTAAAGGGLWCGDDSELTLSNTTFRGNVAPSGGGAMRITRNTNGLANLLNCILWNNGPNEISLNLATVDVAYSDVRNGWPGTGNISADPMFVRNPDTGLDGVWGTSDDDYGDLHLTVGSPCIDAGDPAFVPLPGERDLAGRLRVWEGDGNSSHIVDMGAYEFGSPPVLPGDLNCDGLVNNFDIDAFVLALTDAAAYSATYPNCDRNNADIDADGNVNNFDIDPFVVLLTGG